MEITISETGLSIIFLLIMLISLYIFGLIVFFIYRLYRKFKYDEKIVYSKLFKEPIIGVADFLGYALASILRVIF